MDEKELETLFRAAPGEPPPPGFSLSDVTAASARAKERRRSALLLTAACLVAVLSAAGIAGVSYFRSTETSTAQPVTAPERLPGTSPVPSPLQGSGGNGKDGPRAEGTSGCEKVDR
ncbi:flagellar basal body-associated FliL family protein, partial [Amycolatopsis acidiphila]